MINFNFTLDDEEATWLFDLLHEEKCRMEKAEFQAENIDKNVNMAKYFENHLKYLANMRKKMLDGQTRISPCPIPSDTEQKLDIICSHCGINISFKNNEVYSSKNKCSYVCLNCA